MEEKIRLDALNKQAEDDLRNIQAQIAIKNNKITDLKNMLEKTHKNSTRSYVYALIVIHFLFMLLGWSHNKGVVFISNLWMHYWFIKKLYRDIYMRFALPSAILVIVVSIGMTFQK